jgi:hypothetical protein
MRDLGIKAIGYCFSNLEAFLLSVKLNVIGEIWRIEWYIVFLISAFHF